MSTPSENEEVPSPCIGVCHLDLATGVCSGCARTLEEIQTWPFLDDATRRAIVKDLRERASKDD